MLQPRCNRVKRLVPRNLLKTLEFPTFGKRAFGHASLAAQRVQNALRRVNPIQIFGYLAAKEALRHRVGRVALNLDGPAFAVYAD
jgi:hypothetical protein